MNLNYVGFSLKIKIYCPLNIGSRESLFSGKKMQK